MSAIIAIASAVVLILLGVVLRVRLRFPPELWAGLERVTYWVLLPSLLMVGLAGADFASIDAGPVILVLAVSVALSSLAAYAARRPAAGRDGPAFTSLFQGTVRFNNYIGVTIAAALFGDEGVALAALANVVLVPAGNLASTLVFARHGRQELRGAALVRAVFSNPLLVACAAGLAVNLIGTLSPVEALLRAEVPNAVVTLFATVLDLLGRAALPIGLLCVGAGLRRSAAGSPDRRPVAVALVLRLVVVPGATLLICVLLSFSGPEAIVCVVFQALPTATSSYVFSRRLGGDAPLMARITAAQTIVSVATLPGWILLASAVLT